MTPTELESKLYATVKEAVAKIESFRDIYHSDDTAIDDTIDLAKRYLSGKTIATVDSQSNYSKIRKYRESNLQFLLIGGAAQQLGYCLTEISIYQFHRDHGASDNGYQLPNAAIRFAEWSLEYADKIGQNAQF